MVHCLSSAFAAVAVPAFLVESVVLVHAAKTDNVRVASMSCRGSFFISSLLLMDGCARKLRTQPLQYFSVLPVIAVGGTLWLTQLKITSPISRLFLASIIMSIRQTAIDARRTAASDEAFASSTPPFCYWIFCSIV